MALPVDVNDSTALIEENRTGITREMGVSKRDEGEHDSMAAMKTHVGSTTLTRRRALQLSMGGTLGLGMRFAFHELISAQDVTAGRQVAEANTAEGKLYSGLLKTWCDGLLARQVSVPNMPEFRGGFLCAACGLIHGRCGDAVYPLLCVAHSTGDDKYLRSALEVHAWSERMVSRPDGSWVNDVSLSTLQGITVFHAIAMAEAIEHHGTILDAAVLMSWKDRLARAANFLDGFISVETGNINYPATASLAFLLCGRVLSNDHYVERGRGLAHAVLAQFTEDGFLVGEGHPLNAVSAKGCRPVDLGYNVEESLPALAMYALLASDKEVQEKVTVAMKTNLEFMLPDGAWDNSWGTRNYKWTWWGSRTSDGCHPGMVMMSKVDARFREAARRNAELMAACTHDGLLYGGPDYFAHGDLPCIHHTFTHAKALAGALDRGDFAAEEARPKLPRDEAYGLKTFPVIGTRLAAIGPWRATVTDYDFEYVENVQAGNGNSGGGHASGGALSLLYHLDLGPILVASMTKYAMVEISNQQTYRAGSHMTLTPRIEMAGKETYTSLDDMRAVVTAARKQDEILFDARGRMLTTGHKPPLGGDVLYRFAYTIRETGVELMASVTGAAPGLVRLIVPVIARADEMFSRPDLRTLKIAKSKGMLTAVTDAVKGFEVVPQERTFNLVPGLEAIPLTVVLQAGKEVRVKIAVER